MKRITKLTAVLALLIITLLPFSIKAQETEGQVIVGVGSWNTSARFNAGYLVKYGDGFSYEVSLDVVYQGHKGASGLLTGPSFILYYSTTETFAPFIGLSYRAWLSSERKIEDALDCIYCENEWIKLSQPSSMYAEFGFKFKEFSMSLNRRFGKSRGEWEHWGSDPWGVGSSGFYDEDTYELDKWIIHFGIKSVDLF